MSFEITIPDLNPIIQALLDYPDIAEPIIQAATDSALLGLIPDLADYPPELPGQRYVRTGQLRDGWQGAQPQWQAIPSGFEGSIENPTGYDEWVQGVRTQGRAFRGRWPTDQAIVDAHAVEIEHAYDTALQDIANAIDAKMGGH